MGGPTKFGDDRFHWLRFTALLAEGLTPKRSNATNDTACRKKFRDSWAQLRIASKPCGQDSDNRKSYLRL